jgi:hypothetical protein
LLLQTFAIEARARLASLHARLAEQDWRGLRESAGTLRDTAATIGRQDVTDLADAIIAGADVVAPGTADLSALLQQLSAAIG